MPNWMTFAEFLGAPAAVLALGYTIMQMRKLWYDTQKSILDVQKAEIETRKNEADPSTPAAEQPSKQAIAPETQGTLRRSDIAVFVPYLLFMFGMFRWHGHNAKTPHDLYQVMHDGLLFALAFQMFLFIRGLRVLSRMLIDSDSFISQAIFSSFKSQNAIYMPSPSDSPGANGS